MNDKKSGTFFIAGSLQHAPISTFATSGGRVTVLTVMTLPIAGDHTESVSHRVMIWHEGVDHTVQNLRQGDRVLVQGRHPVRVRQTGSDLSPLMYEFTAESVRPLPKETVSPEKKAFRSEVFAALRRRRQFEALRQKILSLDVPPKRTSTSS